MRRVGTNNGYQLIYLPEHPRAWKTGYVYEHIVVMEQKLGRPLRLNEVVHHKDENKLNNRPDNLDLMETPSKHASYHAAKLIKPPLQLVCTECGLTFSRSRNNRPEIKGYKHAFCSRRCSGKFNRRQQLKGSLRTS